MENKRKIPKRIFSLFLAILCTFGILFVSYIDSFAEAITCTVSFTRAPSSWSNRGSFSVRNMTTSSYVTDSATSTFYFSVILDNVYRLVGSAKKTSSAYWSYWTFYYNGEPLSTSSSNPTIIYDHSPLTITSTLIDSSDSSGPVQYYYFSMVSYTPSPEPTPTPAPTPTPDPYGPGPVPTIPPGDASYTSFFNRLASDAQNAFNAIFLSWQNANNKFYSGLFFIGFPVLLGIIGLVASIFFGDDD